MSIEPIRRQSIVSLVWQIAFTFIGFLRTMYFARAVGAGVLGAYFLFLAYLGIIGLMTDGGIVVWQPSASVREKKTLYC
ncbi:polysaccharide biosynthesis protein [groundwater metagenome]